MTTPRIGLIWAQAHKGVIGNNGGIPWHIPEDLALFKAITMGHPTIMGRRTWQSLPGTLPGRLNIVVTSAGYAAGPNLLAARSLDEAIKLAGDVEQVWVIGGSRLYEEAIKIADVLEVTYVDLDVAGDTLAPKIGEDWLLDEAFPLSGDWLTSVSGTRYQFERWTRETTHA